MSRVITLYPVTDPLVMYKIHRYYTELELNRTFVETRTLQNAIKDMLLYLPDGKLTSCRFTFSDSYKKGKQYLSPYYDDSIEHQAYLSEGVCLLPSCPDSYLI